MFSVPMNKIVVGSAPSPNLMSAQSRIGSLANTQHRVSGFNTSIIIVKYVNPHDDDVFSLAGATLKLRTASWSGAPRPGPRWSMRTTHPGAATRRSTHLDIFVRFIKYFYPQIENRKLNWNAQSKIKSLDNHTHKPGGGDKKIENRKLEWNVDSR